MFLNEFKIIRQIKFCLAKIWFPFFILQYNLSFLFKKNKITTRLFTSTGNISLINILSIINEIGNFNAYEDYLLVDTGKGRKDFIKKTLQLAKLHKFKKVFFVVNIRMETEIILNNICYVDEIYLLNHPVHIEPVKKIYNKTPITIIDEGAGSLLNYNSDKIQNLKSFKSHKYLNKLDFLGLEDLTTINFENIDINAFKNIATNLSEKYPINTNGLEKEKTILYCGVYWEVSGLDRETFAREQNILLKNLINAGYSILYKAHPRDNDFYGLENNSKVFFIDCKFPIELYNIDILALVSMSSTASLTTAHYWDVPCFSNVLDAAISKKENSVNINVIRYMVKEYSPNYKELLKLNVVNTPRDILKQQIKDIYMSFIKDKPLLSQNENIKEYVKQYGM